MIFWDGCNSAIFDFGTDVGHGYGWGFHGWDDVDELAICRRCFAIISFNDPVIKRVINCERSELNLHFEWTKVIIKKAKMVQSDKFLKILSFRSNSVSRQVNFNRTKLVENAKIQMRHFQTMWLGTFWYALEVYFQCKKSYKMIQFIWALLALVNVAF